METRSTDVDVDDVMRASALLPEVHNELISFGGVETLCRFAVERVEE